jgi:hypothetical protein
VIASETMSGRLRTHSLALAIVAAAIAGLPARAQAQMRPFQGLFGTDSDRRQTLVANFSLYGGYDDNVVGNSQAGGTATRAAQVGSSLAGVSANLAYAKNGQRLNYALSLDSGARYFPEASDLSAASYGLGAGLGYKLSRYSRLSLSQAVSYRPRYQLGLLDSLEDPTLGEAVPSNLDFTVTKRESWIYRTTVGFDRQLGRRTDLGLTYSFYKQDFQGGDAMLPPDPLPTTPLPGPGDPLSPTTTFIGTFRDVTIQAGGFKLQHKLSRGFGLHAGYTYSRADYPAPQNRLVEQHILDIGADYSRGFSPSRKTTFTFSTGSGIIERAGIRRFRLTGTAALVHQFSRMWVGNVRYRRGLGFLGAFDEPYFADTVTTGLTGYLSTRVRWNLQAGYTSGQIGLQTAPDKGVKTVSGSTSMDVVITPLLSAFAQYIYYQYEFQQGVSLPAGLDRQFDRQGVRVGLMLRLPLIQ